MSDVDDLELEIAYLKKGWTLFPRGIPTRVGLIVLLVFGALIGRMFILAFTDRTATARCRAGEDAACVLTAYNDFRNKSVYVKEWEQRANIDLGCRRGYAPACELQSKRRSACLFGADTICASLADAHIRGIEVDYVDGPYGVLLLEHACDAGGEQSCRALADVYGHNGLGIVTGDDAHYRDMLRAICERTSDFARGACSQLATVLEYTDAAAAQPYFKRACELGDGDACYKVPKTTPRL